MNDIQTDLNRFVAGFVAEVTELARRAAIDTLESALNGRGPRQAKAVSTSAAPRTLGRGAKRDSGAIAELADRFIRAVTESPGLRIEQINKQLGTTTKDLALPVRKLLADGAVKAKGHKRSTTYFPGSKRAMKAAAAAS